MMDRAVLTRYINIATFLLRLSALLKVITDNVANLKVTCILLLVYALLNTARDIWSYKVGK